MSSARLRELPVEGGRVQCTPGRHEEVMKCRFCAHSTHFMVKGRWVGSPARAYCRLQRSTEEVDLHDVAMVRCDDATGEGFRSIMSLIS
jgi:hypothetical protein